MVFLFIVVFVVSIIYLISDNIKRERIDKESKERYTESLERQNKELNIKLKNTVLDYDAAIDKLKSEFDIEKKELKEKLRKELWENCKKYMEDKSVSMPWLAAGMADFMTLQEEAIIQILQLGNHRDWERSIKINDLKKEKKALIAENKLLRYQIAYFKRIVPEIEELDDFDYIPVHYDTENDAIKAYLSDDEYNELSETEKNQLALERYWKRKKSKWEIGRDFERYYGYLLEQRGYKVIYFGIDKGFEDMGRDLIAENDKHILGHL